MRAAGIFGALLAPIAAACADVGPGGVEITTDASGVEVVRFGATVVAELPELHPTLGLRIGTLDGPEELTFGAPIPRLRSDGRVLVADALASEVRLFDADGTHRATFGGAGEGPGEFRRLGELFVLPGDSAVAYDYGNRRVTVFGPDGAFARSFVLEAPPGSDAVAPALEDVFRSGDYLVRLNVPSTPGGASGIRRGSVKLHRYGPDGTPGAPIGTFPDEEVLNADVDGTPLLMDMPLGRESFFAARGAGVVLTTAADWRVQFLDEESVPLRTVVRDVEPAPLTDGHVRATLARFDDLPGPVGSVMRRGLEDVRWPADLPPISALGTTPDGSVWVAGPAAPGDAERAWLRLDGRGIPRGVLRMPAGFRPTDFGERYLLGRNVDELDTPVVELWRIEEGAPEESA